ncbi:translation initiation factor IF-6 [Caldiplasma sukawensis]
MIKKLSIFSNPFIGLYVRAFDDVAIIPSILDDNVKAEVKEVLGVKLLESSVDPSYMYGVFSVINGNGLIVSGFQMKGKIDFELGDRNIMYMDEVINAVGNDIIANDHAAMIHEDYDPATVKKVEDVLGVETVRGRIGAFPTVGSAAVVTNRGMLVNPEVDEDSMEILKDLFKVEIKTGTANFGSPMVGASIIANSKGVLVGSDTTSIELLRIDDVFFPSNP